MSVIETKNLSYYYNKGEYFQTKGIENLNISIDENQIIGVMGHTGSGKSTFAQLLNGLLKPDSGEIFLNGKNIWKDFKDIKDVHFKVGLTFQYPEHQLFGETVYKDIAFGPTNQGLSDIEIKNRVLESANFVGIDNKLLFKSPFDLSGGEKRRVAIAGIIAMNPEILILDEPTAGLDPIAKKELLESICSYHKRTKNIIIFISHVMEDIAQIADKVAVFNKGKLEMFGVARNVFSNHEKLESIGLGVPQITRIMRKVHENGFGQNKCILTIDEAVDDVMNILKRKWRE